MSDPFYDFYKKTLPWLSDEDIQLLLEANKARLKLAEENEKNGVYDPLVELSKTPMFKDEESKNRFMNNSNDDGHEEHE